MKLLCENVDALHIKRSKFTASMTLILSLLALYACVIGICKESIYNDVLSSGVITKLLLLGSKGQDLIFIPLAISLALLSLMFIIKPNIKVFITILGLSGNFFYGYGLYALQGQYTAIYLIYLAIFGLSVYIIVFGLLCLKTTFLTNTFLPKAVRISTGIFLFSIVIMLGIIWILRIMPDIARNIPQDTYGVFVLDLCIVFPAIAITATKLIRSKTDGNILSGVVLMKVFTVCLSWGFGEWYLRLNKYIVGDYSMLAIPAVLAIVGLIFFVIYIFSLKISC